MAESAKKVCIKAPCKINLHLCIGERRPDGFHNIESLFACLAFADTLKFVSSEKEGECLLFTDPKISHGEENGAFIPPEDNLVFKTVSLFRKQTGYKDGLKIYLKKQIPIGAGLGGGSSNAASTLLALNFLAENRASTEELMEMAAILGSDVPFFLSGGIAFVSGRGELIEPLETASLNRLWVVLVKPPFSSNTANAYKFLDISRQSAKNAKIETKFSKPESSFAPRTEGSTRLYESSLQEDPGNWPFKNDFLPVFLGAGGEKSRVYQAILEDLRKAGASFASLSGAGSCCFGVFLIKKTAEKAAKYLNRQGNFARLTFFLANRANPVVE